MLKDITSLSKTGFVLFSAKLGNAVSKLLLIANNSPNARLAPLGVGNFHSQCGKFYSLYCCASQQLPPFAIVSMSPVTQKPIFEQAGRKFSISEYPPIFQDSKMVGELLVIV